MSKTRRQRADEHPHLPKKGVRDPARKPKAKNPAAVALGKLGGRAPHIIRGLAAMSPEKRASTIRKGQEMAVLLRKTKKEQNLTGVTTEEGIEL